MQVPIHDRNGPRARELQQKRDAAPATRKPVQAAGPRRQSCFGLGDFQTMKTTTGGRENSLATLQLLSGEISETAQTEVSKRWQHNHDWKFFNNFLDARLSRCGGRTAWLKRSQKVCVIEKKLPRRIRG